MWGETENTPELSGEIICQHLHKLELRNPAEQTSAHVTAGILVAMHGPMAGHMLSVTEVNRHYDWFKVRQNLQQMLR